MYHPYPRMIPVETTMSTSTNDFPTAVVEKVCTLPVVCLQTANFDLNVGDIIRDKNTIIDLWTTRCTRCPAALDTLNEFAAGVTDPDDIATSMQCVSICCGDTLDGAREIIEATKLPRWSAIQHFFMAYNDKERFKQLLQFRQVPFYIVFDRNGTLLYSGNQKMDWSALFQEPSNHSTSVKQLLGIHSKSITVTEVSVHSPTSSLTIPTSQIVQPQQNSPQQNHEEDVPSLVIDDMDF